MSEFVASLTGTSREKLATFSDGKYWMAVREGVVDQAKRGVGRVNNLMADSDFLDKLGASLVSRSKYTVSHAGKEGSRAGQ